MEIFSTPHACQANLTEGDIYVLIDALKFAASEEGHELMLSHYIDYAVYPKEVYQELADLLKKR